MNLLRLITNVAVKSAMAGNDPRKNYRGGARPSLWCGLLGKSNYKRVKAGKNR